MRQNRRELLFAGGADKRKTGSSPKGLRMVRRGVLPYLRTGESEDICGETVRRVFGLLVSVMQKQN